MSAILIVEDDVKLRQLLQSYIEKYGYSVVAVTGFNNVMETFKTAQPNLVILDIHLSVKVLTLFPERMELTYHSKKLELTKKEMLLLEMLMKSHQRVVNRNSLLSNLWDNHQFVAENTLNVYITRVHKKLKEIGIEDAIETVRGAGYRLNTAWVEKR